MFEDITIKKAANPIFINTTRRLRTPEKVGPGRVRNIVIRNVTVTEVEQTHQREPPNAATISGLPEAPHELGVASERTVADDRVLGVGVDVHHRREVVADAAR